MCLFPFKRFGKTYHQCTTDNYGTKSWCPTWLDKGGTYRKGDYFGTCSPECPGYDEGGWNIDYIQIRCLLTLHIVQIKFFEGQYSFNLSFLNNLILVHCYDTEREEVCKNWRAHGMCKDTPHVKLVCKKTCDDCGI